MSKPGDRRASIMKHEFEHPELSRHVVRLRQARDNEGKYGLSLQVSSSYAMGRGRRIGVFSSETISCMIFSIDHEDFLVHKSLGQPDIAMLSLQLDYESSIQTLINPRSSFLA